MALSQEQILTHHRATVKIDTKQKNSRTGVHPKIGEIRHLAISDGLLVRKSNQQDWQSEQKPNIPGENRYSVTSQPHFSRRQLLCPLGSFEQPPPPQTVHCPTARPPRALFCSPVETVRLPIFQPRSVVLFVLRPYNAVETDKAKYKHRKQSDA